MLIDDPVQAMDPAKVPAIRGEIWQLMHAAEMHRDLGLEEQPDLASLPADAVIDRSSLPKVKMPAHDRFVPGIAGDSLDEAAIDVAGTRWPCVHHLAIRR